MPPLTTDGLVTSVEIELSALQYRAIPSSGSTRYWPGCRVTPKLSGSFFIHGTVGVLHVAQGLVDVSSVWLVESRDVPISFSAMPPPPGVADQSIYEREREVLNTWSIP